MWLDSTSSAADTSKQGGIAESDRVICIRKYMSHLSNQFLLYFKSVSLTSKNAGAVLSLLERFCCSVQREQQ